MINMNEIWIVAVSSEEYGRTFLADYAGDTRDQVINKVMAVARTEGFRGHVDERLHELGWEIVKVALAEIQPL